MRKVFKDPADQPAILTNPRTLALLETLSRAADSSQINDSYFQGPYSDAENRTQSSVRDKLNEYYFHKCAYCETLCKAHIEHYRPKKAVKEDPNHPGYYWLCYEWSNLIPSCPDCNTFGGKGNMFPVQPVPGARLEDFPIHRARVTSPQFRADGTIDKAHSLASSPYLLAEQPYLLHPEVDEPIDYLGIELDPTGKGVNLTGIDGAGQRGEQTIRICNLNRTSLQLSRLASLDSIITFINISFNFMATGAIDLQALFVFLGSGFKQADENKVNPKEQHTFLFRYIMETPANFNAVVLPCLQPAQQAIVEQAFLRYLQNRP